MKKGVDGSRGVCYTGCVMRNLDDLKEQLQEDAITWHDGLESNHVNQNDMDTLCNIVIERVNELKKHHEMGTN